MRGLRSRVVSAVARRYLRRAGTQAFDMSALGRLPESTLMPLRRDGLDPVAELGAARATAPVSRLSVPFGLNVWLVTGHAQAKAVLADADSFSTDFANLTGVGVPGSTNPGGLGFADPPVHTRLRKLLTPEF